MNIAYTIMTVDDSRKDLKDKLRENMSIPEITDIKYIDGRIPGVTDDYIKKHSLTVHGGGFHYGELGVWFSQMESWRHIANTDYEGVIVLEDDAVVLQPQFDNVMPIVMEYLPNDYDFISLLIPQDQRQDYFYDRLFDHRGNWVLHSHVHRNHFTSDHYIGNPYVATAYQGYSCVATMYSPKGAEKLLRLVDKEGIWTPVDCFIFCENFMGELEGFAMMPDAPVIFEYIEKGSIARSTGMFAND